MAVRGVLFALTEDQRRQLLEAVDDDSKLSVLEEIEEAWDQDNLVETDKAWDAIHRALAREDRETGELATDPAKNPLALVILGGRQVLTDESGYIIRLIEPDQIPAIVAALKPIDEAAFRTLYDEYCRGVEPEYDDEGFEYTWDYFQGVRMFFNDIADRGRTVIFAVDQ